MPQPQAPRVIRSLPIADGGTYLVSVDAARRTMRYQRKDLPSAPGGLIQLPPIGEVVADRCGAILLPLRWTFEGAVISMHVQASVEPAFAEGLRQGRMVRFEAAPELTGCFANFLDDEGATVERVRLIATKPAQDQAALLSIEQLLAAPHRFLLEEKTMPHSDDATATQRELRLILEVTSDCPGLYAAVISVDAGDLQRFERMAVLAKENELSELRAFFYPLWAGNAESYGSPDLQEMCFTNDSLWCCGEMVGPFRTAEVVIARLRAAFDAGVKDVLVTDYNRDPADLLNWCGIRDIDLHRAGKDLLVLEARSELTLEELARRGYVEPPEAARAGERGG